MLNRRQFIQGVSAVGAASLMGIPRIASAQVDGKESVLLWIFMNGGYAPTQTSAASFIGNAPLVRFGCTADNMTVRDEVSFLTANFGQLPEKALSRLACIGSIGASNHNSGKHFWEGSEGPTVQTLAAAMGGNAAIKAAKVGDVTGSPGGSSRGVSLEQVNSMSTALETLTGKGQIILPDQRPIVGKLLNSSYLASKPLFDRNPNNLKALASGYENLINSMSSPVDEVNQAEITMAYAGAQDGGLSQKLGVAEALFRSGVKVVCVGEGAGTYWDTHDDNDGSRQKAYFSLMTPGLTTFCNRMLGTTKYNVTIAFVSEHSRIPLISNHGPHLSTIIISDNAIGGKSTGITDNEGLVYDADKKPEKVWKAALGELCGLTGSANPFGSAAIHRKVIRSAQG